MRKTIIALIMSMFALFAVIGGSIPMIIENNNIKSEIAALKEKKPDRSYTFKVEDHVIAVLTSEVQEITHDMYLAYCKRGVNEAFIEVPVNDKSTELELVYTGYQITYTLERGLIDSKVSNNGWALV